MPVSIERERHRHVLCCREYWVTPKVHGTRVAVVFGQAASGSPCAVVMDRCREMFGLPIVGPDAIFKGTILDAELALSKVDGMWHLLIFDVAMVAAKLVEGTLGSRLSIIRTLCTRLSSPKGFILQLKPMVALTPTMDLSAFQALLSDFESDGIIFTPEAEGPARPGMAPSILKLKTTHTLDLWWTDGVEAGLWFGDSSDMVSVKTLRPKVVVQGLPEKAPSMGVVVEVSIDLVDDRHLYLGFISTRPKKQQPNNALCVLRTLVSAQDNVQLKDVLGFTAPDPSLPTAGSALEPPASSLPP